jgi:uncharacterized protein involved in exopolysaccharide biosynthesis
LVQEGVLTPGAELRVGFNLKSEIFVSRRAEERELAPLLKAKASWSDPEIAAAVASTWAQVFLERTGDLVRGSTSPTVAFLEEQYPISRARLAESEDDRVETANHYQERLDTTFTNWDRRITDFKNQLTKSAAEYEAEAYEMIEKHIAETNLETVAKQLEALRTTFSELQQEQASVESRVEQRELELEAGRAQLAQTQRYLDLNKAITDDALWQAVTESGEDSVDWEKVRERTLVTQVVNPVYSNLAATVAEIEMELRALQPRSRQLEERLERLASQLQQLELDYRTYEAERERLVQERDADLEVLRESGIYQVGVMERDRNRVVQAIIRERDARLAQLDRDINQQKALHGDLGENYNQALVAKAQTDVEDVRLGAPAVPPERPVPSHLGLSLLLGAVLGTTLGIAVGLVRDVGQA